jgi:hypothetical protein
MNVNQKILTGVALVAFLVSICNASWEKVQFNEGKIQAKTVEYSPIWQQPTPPWYEQSSGEFRDEYHLLWSPLIGIWITIGVVYTGLFFLLKNTQSVFALIKHRTKETGKK